MQEIMEWFAGWSSIVELICCDPCCGTGSFVNKYDDKCPVLPCFYLCGEKDDICYCCWNLLHCQKNENGNTECRCCYKCCQYNGWCHC